MMNVTFKSLWATILSSLFVVSCSNSTLNLDIANQRNSNAISGNMTAFKNVNLIPMTDERIIKNQTVLVKGTRIIEIGPSSKVSIPKSAKVIAGAGAYLMPGLADMHMHMRRDWLSDVWPVSPLNLYLANGVTTIRCFGPEGRSPNYVLRWRNEINKGKRSGPTIYTAGPILYGPVEDPQRIVREQKAQGFDFIKLYSFLSKEEFNEAVTTAKQLGMYTAGHIPFSIGLDGVLSEDMDEIAHIEELDFEFLDFDRNKKLHPKQWFLYLIEAAVQQYGRSFGLDIEELEERHGEAISVIVDKLQSANIPICTTLVVGEVIVRKLFEPEAFLARPENKYLPQWYMDAFVQGKEKHQVQFRGHEDFAPFKHAMEKILLMKLKQGGILLLLSTDAGTGGMGIVPGFSIHDELRILTENGFTPYEAIVTGTINASKVVEAMTGKDDFGTIEVGKRADLILAKENPLEDVANIKELRGVMATGRWYEEAKLQKMITPGIPITGAIHHIHEPDNRFKTSIEVVIGEGFTGNLPDDVNRMIPIPDPSTFSPAQGETLTSKTPSFSWGAVEYSDIAIYYRLVIDDHSGNRVFSTRRVQNMLSYTVPQGVLKPGQAYRWRVRVTDSDDWIEMQNRSHSEWLSPSIHKFGDEFIYSGLSAE